ncbi:MAG: hypothetical protein WCI73_18650, partial [Phycisphaerae bacterium]
MVSTRSVSATPASAGTVHISVPNRLQAPVPSVEQALAKAQATLLSKQAPDGYWVGELQGDSILESEYIL